MQSRLLEGTGGSTGGSREHRWEHGWEQEAREDSEQHRRERTAGWATAAPAEEGRSEVCSEGTGSSICRWVGLGGRGRENNQDLSTEQRHFPKMGRAGGTGIA